MGHHACVMKTTFLLSKIEEQVKRGMKELMNTAPMP
ncbi:hypothetical protein PSE_1728 [Pseudovibrio sp. FO-BEG1]|nr:hypothetical protein PSE_1728 [Pseudovibrio sp. FO-BEG1]